MLQIFVSFPKKNTHLTTVQATFFLLLPPMPLLILLGKALSFISLLLLMHQCMTYVLCNTTPTKNTPIWPLCRILHFFRKKTSTRVRPDERAPYDISDRSPAGCARSQRSKREQVTLPTQLRLCNARARTHLQKRAQYVMVACALLSRTYDLGNCFCKISNTQKKSVPGLKL